MPFDEDLEKGYQEQKAETLDFETEVDEVLRADKRALDALIMSKVDLPKIREGIDWYNKKIERAGKPKLKLEYKGLWLEARQSHMKDRIIEGQSYWTYVVMITSNWKESTPSTEKHRYVEFRTQNVHAKVQLTLTRKMLEEDMVDYKYGYDFTEDYREEQEHQVISLSEFWKKYRQWLIDHVDGKDYWY